MNLDERLRTFTVDVGRHGGWKPWSAMVTEGVGVWEGVNYSARTPEGAVAIATCGIARYCAATHRSDYRVLVNVEDGWA